MFDKLKQFFEAKPRVSFGDLLAKGAVVVDVRSRSEFAAGHFPDALNLPLQKLQNGELKLPKDKAIITCCASGMRSATAKKWLDENGYTSVVNAGPWQNLF